MRHSPLQFSLFTLLMAFTVLALGLWAMLNADAMIRAGLSMLLVTLLGGAAIGAIAFRGRWRVFCLSFLALAWTQVVWEQLYSGERPVRDAIWSQVRVDITPQPLANTNVSGPYVIIPPYPADWRPTRDDFHAVAALLFNCFWSVAGAWTATALWSRNQPPALPEQADTAQ